jgi:PAS domain S-box-containing protein
MPRPTARDLLRAAGIAALYYAAGRLGLALASVNDSATAVWPPTGIALAALLLYGYRAWPAVLVGAFLVNSAVSGPGAVSLAIAMGNTLEAVAGAWLVRRFAGGTQAFEDPRRIFVYAAVVLVATAVSPLIGVTSLAGAGAMRWSDFGPVWITWWLGDVSGALVFAPFLVLWSLQPRVHWTARRAGEAFALFASLILIGSLVFGGASSLPGASAPPLEFLCVPVLVWAAFRFSPREAATATVFLSGIAIIGTLQGVGPFSRGGPNESLLLLQSYTAVTAVLVLAVTAALAERRRGEDRVRSLAEELERRVEVRTGELRRAVDTLRREALEREQAQEALEQSEARLRDAQRVARVGSWEWDIERDSLWWSDGLYELYGVDRATFPATFESFLARVHPEDRPLVRRVVEAAYQNRQPFKYEHRIVRPDGSVATVSARGRVVTGANGRPVRMLGTGQDITDEKRAEEERAHLLVEREARRQAEEANRLKDEFLATLSHELRTPLNAIVGWANLLREGNLDPATTTRAVETISRNAQVQSRLISDILDISRLIAGQLDFKLQMVSLEAVIEGALDTMRPAAAASGVVLDANLARGVGPVLGSPDRLQQVVWNLLSNAIKFTPEGSRVWITLEATDGLATILVEDEGIGIDPDFLPHVFERFRQKNPSSSRRHGGLGLGLAIARHIVEFHGGTITAENRDGARGARFVVTLPLVEAPAEPARPETTSGAGREAAAAPDKSAPRAEPRAEASGANAAPPGGTEAESDPAAHPLAGVRALLVEDEPDSRELLARLLSSCGAEVRMAGSAAEALVLLSNEQPNLLISDIAMPGETGYDLIERVRSLAPESGGTIPAIAVTAYTGAEDARRALRSGYQAHLSKPVQLRELVRLVAELMNGASLPSGTPRPSAPHDV